MVDRLKPPSHQLDKKQPKFTTGSAKVCLQKRDCTKDNKASNNAIAGDSRARRDNGETVVRLSDSGYQIYKAGMASRRRLPCDGHRRRAHEPLHSERGIRSYATTSQRPRLKNPPQLPNVVPQSETAYQYTLLRPLRCRNTAVLLPSPSRASLVSQFDIKITRMRSPFSSCVPRNGLCAQLHWYWCDWDCALWSRSLKRAGHPGGNPVGSAQAGRKAAGWPG